VRPCFQNSPRIVYTIGLCQFARGWKIKRGGSSEGTFHGPDSIRARPAQKGGNCGVRPLLLKEVAPCMAANQKDSSFIIHLALGRRSVGRLFGHVPPPPYSSVMYCILTFKLTLQLFAADSLLLIVHLHTRENFVYYPASAPLPMTDVGQIKAQSEGLSERNHAPIWTVISKPYFVTFAGMMPPSGNGRSF
jgi:hypothetical protein